MTDGKCITRRRALQTLLVSGGVACRSLRLSAAQDPPKQRLGLVSYCCNIRRRHLKRQRPDFDLHAPANFLEHCRQLGAGGMQVALGVLDPAAARVLRNQVEQAGMFVEGIISVSEVPANSDLFAAQMRTAADVGAKAVRTTIIPGRRYEYFKSLDMFREYEARGRRYLEVATPIAERYRLPIAVENHKDHRNAERVKLFEHISSEYVGACVDTGNSFALLEDPLETVRALAPWAHAVHLKDQAVQLNSDGFLLGDIALGQGCFDLPAMVDILKKQKPEMRFCLELITRDPLHVPVLSEGYWATFPDLPAHDLARTLRFVRDHAADSLQTVSTLDDAERLAQEDANVRVSLDYARTHLGL